MKTIIYRITIVLSVLICTIQAFGQDLGLGTHSDSFHIRCSYESGVAQTFAVTSPMNVTFHTYLDNPESSSYSVEDVTTITVRDNSTGNIVATQSGSLYRKYVYDPYQACLVISGLPAGTYSVVIDGDETTLLTMEGHLATPLYSLDGREAGQPIEIGTFSTGFGYSHIRDTSGEDYWASYGSPSNDVFYRFTLNVPMYVVVTHWDTEPMSEYVPSSLSILGFIPGPDSTQYPELGHVSDIYAAGNLIGENMTDLEITPDLLPEIEENSPLNASWHGNLMPGTYFIVSEGPYISGGSTPAFNGLIRTNIRGFVISDTAYERKDIRVGVSDNGFLEFEDCKYHGMLSDDKVRYTFSLDTDSDLSVTTDADTLLLEKSGIIIDRIVNPGEEQWDSLSKGDYILTLSSSTAKMVSVSLSSEKYEPPYIPEILDDNYTYIRVSRPFIAGHSDPTMLDLYRSSQSIEYYDGMGRPLQTVRRRESPIGEDLATYIRYEYGRPVEQWAETPSGLGNSLKPYASMMSFSSAAYDDDKVFVETVYEESPLNRIIAETGLGKVWHNSGKSVSIEYMVNDSIGVLSCLRFTPPSDYGSTSVPSISGVYPAGTLTVVRNNSEDGVVSYTFTDNSGQTVLTRILSGDNHIDTYYIYDVRKMLRAVITPSAIDFLNLNGSLSSSVFEDYCYAYGYDSKGRCTSFRMPGSGVYTTLYSPSGRILFTQSPRQAASNIWTFDIPDLLGRTALSGTCIGTYASLKSISDNDIHAVFGEGTAATGFWEASASLNYHELHKICFYDNYEFMELFGNRASLLNYVDDGLCASRRDIPGTSINCHGLQTGMLTAVTDNEEISGILSSFYYDIYGNITQTRSENVLGGISQTSTLYDFQGRVISEAESHNYGAGLETMLTRNHEYDRAGRLLESETTLDGVEVVTRNTYDPFGRLEMTVVSSDEVSDTTRYSYNVRGWQTSIENGAWSSELRYTAPILDGSVQSFAGNISEWEWTRGNTTDAYSLSYDALSRITGSRLFRNGTQTGALSESGIGYDANGNILSLKRTGESGSTINDLTYTYDGNRLTRISEGGSQSQIYTYDADGNMTFDGRTELSLTWNDLGLVKKVSRNGTDLVNYSYLADGTKVSALDSEGDGLLYLSSLIYRKTGNAIELESAGFAGGMFVAKDAAAGGKVIVPMFHVTDHLGSVRAVVDGVSGTVVETNDYYPFGSRWDVATSLKDESNRFRYNSKEEQSSLYPLPVRNAVSHIDYGARQYDPVVGRWFAPDPLAEKYYSISPYAFCNNNPVNFVDPDGRDIRVANQYQKQFIADLSAIFADKTEAFSFEGDKLLLNVSKRDFMSGLNRDQKVLFKGLFKALSDETKTSIVYENYVSFEDNGELKSIDVIQEYGGGLSTKDKCMIVVAPDAGNVQVWPDVIPSIPQEVQQNTASVLFHEIGERNESNETNRGSVITYENHARRILNLPKRPYDWNHSNTVPTNFYIAY